MQHPQATLMMTLLKRRKPIYIGISKYHNAKTAAAIKSAFYPQACTDCSH